MFYCTECSCRYWHRVGKERYMSWKRLQRPLVFSGASQYTCFFSFMDDSEINFVQMCVNWRFLFTPPSLLVNVNDKSIFFHPPKYIFHQKFWQINTPTSSINKLFVDFMIDSISLKCLFSKIISGSQRIVANIFMWKSKRLNIFHQNGPSFRLKMDSKHEDMVIIACATIMDAMKRMKRNYKRVCG